MHLKGGRRGAALVLGAVALALGSATARAEAQQRPEPQLLLTIFGGFTSGSSLWEINRQPYGRRSDLTTIDTLRLTRGLQSGLTLGASATLFPRPNLGFTGEIVYLGFDLDDSCTEVYTDPAIVNDGETNQICADLSRQGASAVTLGFYVGGIYRLAPRGFAAPYVRLQGGIAVRNSSTVTMQGRFLLDNNLQTRLVIADPGGAAVHPSASGAIGVMFPFAPGYQARLELRDHLLPAQYVTGVADGQLIPPTGTKLVHSAGLIVQIDIVLEQRRGRRY